MRISSVLLAVFFAYATCSHFSQEENDDRTVELNSKLYGGTINCSSESPEDYLKPNETRDNVKVAQIKNQANYLNPEQNYNSNALDQTGSTAEEKRIVREIPNPNLNCSVSPRVRYSNSNITTIFCQQIQPFSVEGSERNVLPSVFTINQPLPPNHSYSASVTLFNGDIAFELDIHNLNNIEMTLKGQILVHRISGPIQSTSESIFQNPSCTSARETSEVIPVEKTGNTTDDYSSFIKYLGMYLTTNPDPCLTDDAIFLLSNTPFIFRQPATLIISNEKERSQKIMDYLITRFLEIIKGWEGSKPVITWNDFAKKLKKLNSGYHVYYILLDRLKETCIGTGRIDKFNISNVFNFCIKVLEENNFLV